MSMDLHPGDVVLSRAGHDKDRLFVIMETVDEQYVRIADGETRKIEKTKLKKRKHLKAVPGIRLDLETKPQLLNADIRKFLKQCADMNA